MGARLTRGRGAGSDPEVGRAAALEDTEQLIELLGESDMVFVTAGHSLIRQKGPNTPSNNPA